MGCCGMWVGCCVFDVRLVVMVRICVVLFGCISLIKLRVLFIVYWLMWSMNMSGCWVGSVRCWYVLRCCIGLLMWLWVILVCWLFVSLIVRCGF